MLLQYRAAAIAGFGTQLFWGFIKVMVFVAFFEASSSPQPMTFAQVIVYVWLGQALLALLPWNVDQEIAGSGSGWGLQIMKERVEAMGGTFHVESHHKKGTVIRIKIGG